MTTSLLTFLAGAITCGEIVAALFFFRFAKQTGDQLFFSFGVAFLLLALNQALVALAAIPLEERSWLYLLRLGAFLIILIAIWRKNRGHFSD